MITLELTFITWVLLAFTSFQFRFLFLPLVTTSSDMSLVCDLCVLEYRVKSDGRLISDSDIVCFIVLLLE